jgi:hypothetical protein
LTTNYHGPLTDPQIRVIVNEDRTRKYKKQKTDLGKIFGRGQKEGWCFFVQSESEVGPRRDEIGNLPWSELQHEQ